MLNLGKSPNLISDIFIGQRIRIGPFNYEVCPGLAFRQDNYYLRCEGNRNNSAFSYLGYLLDNKYDWLTIHGIQWVAKGDFPYMDKVNLIKCINELRGQCNKKQQK